MESRSRGTGGWAAITLGAVFALSALVLVIGLNLPWITAAARVFVTLTLTDAELWLLLRMSVTTRRELHLTMNVGKANKPMRNLGK